MSYEDGGDGDKMVEIINRGPLAGHVHAAIGPGGDRYGSQQHHSYSSLTLMALLHSQGR